MRTLPILLAALLLALGGCGGGENTSANQSTEPDVTTGTGATTTEAGDPRAGQLTWVQEGCNNCHRIDGMPATSLDGPNFDKTKPDHDTIVDVVTHGKGTMQAFDDTLSPQDVENVAAYIEQAARGS